MLSGATMRIAIVHNEYGKFSGEEAVVRDHVETLKRRGHEICRFQRSSEELHGLGGRVKGCLAGICNPFSVRLFRRFLEVNSPDLIHIHNLYPLISPGILPECRKAGIPVVMTVHNFRLFCPNGLFFREGHICEECAMAGEWRCIRHNCEGNMLKSIGYAARNWRSRRKRYYLDGVDRFQVLSDFQYRKLQEYGIPSERMEIIPNFRMETMPAETPGGNYVAFAGRLSEEKGIRQILQAARKLPDVPFRLAGNGAEAYRKSAPCNVCFCGQLSGMEFQDFLRNSRFGLFASTWYEGFPMTLLDFLAAGKAVIAPEIGSFPEVVSSCGLLFPVADSDAMANRIRKLWGDITQNQTLGNAGREIFLKNYTADICGARLEAMYRSVLAKRVSKASAIIGR